jgi:hypothetical protein
VSSLNGAYARLLLGQERAAAAPALREAIRGFSAIGDLEAVSACAMAVALAVCETAPERAGRLVGAADTLRNQFASLLPPFERKVRDDIHARLSVLLGGCLRAALAEGGSMGADEAVEYALQSLD